MATTKSYQVGRTRIKLAQLLQQKIPGLFIQPADLESQVPYYAGCKMDCASWYAYGERDGMKVHLYSWNTMGDCVKGFDVEQKRVSDIEIHAT